MLTFDDLGVPAGRHVTVNTQYSDTQGVTFNNVSAIDYASRALPIQARSGSSSVSPSSSAQRPITANFTSHSES